MTALSALKSPRPRFARSINVERDSGTNAIDGYLPVGRAIDAITRLAHALDRDDVEVAISITGPYGSGKSSLAVVIDALLGPADDPTRASAENLLEHTAPDALRRLAAARTRLGAERHGFIRATVTAQREPITTTIVRALLHGAERFAPPAGQKARLSSAVRSLRAMHVAASGDAKSRPDTREIREVVAALGKIAPVLLLVDEFGKNLEAFADSRSDADLFLLQELAEWTRGGDGVPLALITLQHMAFNEYADSASAGQRREWAKIQGRFEDIPFVDSAAQTRSLIAAAFEKPDRHLAQAQAVWAADQVKRLRRIGLTDLAADADVLAACWPLHPVALGALPELCERYGQNERTLFSFLAGHEPLSVATYLAETEWRPGGDLPVVRLERLYDYFLETAANLAAVSTNASRWLEIDTRIRDAVGLSPAARRVLKTVGLLNLVSAGGTLRASKAIVCDAAADGEAGTKNATEVETRLLELDAAGLITFRDFADEYRVWHGSDFDLRSAIDIARRRLRDQAPELILNRVLPLGPIVAGRHSHRTGTLRAFARGWTSPDAETIEPLGASDRADGLALYVLGDRAPTAAVGDRADAKPTVFVTAANPGRLIDAAREVGAIDEILAAGSDLGEDWVARRELIERKIEASAALDREFHLTYGRSDSGDWIATKPARRRWTKQKDLSASSVISGVCDAWYASAPILRNDLVNRHDLSSQAAKARRMLLEAMVAGADLENLGIAGFGPDNTMYRSLLHAHGLHREVDPDGWRFAEPSPDDSLRAIWDHLHERLRSATSQRYRVSDLYDDLAAPPFGIRAGIAPVLFVAALIVAAEEVALYEHGTFRPVLADDNLERLLRNPSNFEIKHYASRTGIRSVFLTQLVDTLGIRASRGPRNGRVGSVLAVVSHLVSLTNTLPEHIKKTQHLGVDTCAVRRATMLATEPDDLLFTELPAAFGMPPVPASGEYDKDALVEICDRLEAACAELSGAYPALLESVKDALQTHVGPSCDPLREGLAARAREIEGKIIDQRVAKLTVALTADIPDTESWLAYIAMNVSGAPPEGWTDEDRKRFFVTIADIGGTFRRIHALNADLDARGDGYDAYRSVITRPDGTESVQVITLDPALRSAAQPLLDDAVSRVRDALGSSEAEARSVLLGLLGEADLAAVSQRSTLDVTADAYGERESEAAVKVK